MLYLKKNRRKNKHIEISLTPLIDTALVLLVIFMVATPIINNGLNINLPKSATNENNSVEKNLIIFIDKDNKIYLETRIISMDQIMKELSNIIGSKKRQQVFVNADKSISYGTLITVVDKIKSVPGVENVILSTERAA